MKKKYIYGLVVMLSILSLSGFCEVLHQQYLHLESAWDLALKNHPLVLAQKNEISAEEARKEQAAFYPNPTLFGELEEFGGSNDFDGFTNISARAGISQEFVLGGKIQKEQLVHQQAVEIASLQLRDIQQQIYAEVESDFIEAYFLQEKIALNQSFIQLLEELHMMVEKRVQCGEAPALESLMSQKELAEMRMEYDALERELPIAQSKLASNWGAIQIPENTTLEKPPAYSSSNDLYAELLENNSQYQIVQQSVAIAQAKLQLAKAMRIPDIELETGVQYFREAESYAFFVGFSIPLPVWNTQKGNIQASKENIQKAIHEKEGQLREWKALSQSLLLQLNKIHKTISNLNEQMVPLNTEIYHAARKAYQSGEIGLQELNQFRIPFFQVSMQLLDARMEEAVLYAQMREFSGKFNNGQDNKE